jgi:hypothetical protein
MEAFLEEITDGSVALLLVLGVMAELAQSGALIPQQLNEVMKRALDHVGHKPTQAHRRRRLQSSLRNWNPPRKLRAQSARSRRRAKPVSTVVRRAAAE